MDENLEISVRNENNQEIESVTVGDTEITIDESSTTNNIVITRANLRKAFDIYSEMKEDGAAYTFTVNYEGGESDFCNHHRWTGKCQQRISLSSDPPDDPGKAEEWLGVYLPGC